MKNNPGKLKTEVRRDLPTGISLGWAKDAGMEKRFLELQTEHPQEYRAAFDSWADAMWRWIDEGVPPELESEWRAKLLAERARFSPVSDYTAPASEHDIEHYLQSYLVRRAYFLAGLRHKKEGDPNWFKAFGFYFYIASLLEDDILFGELARLTQRKTSQKQLGKRSLRFWILYLWVPGCFWAMMNDGITAYLRRKANAPYSERSITNAISELKLWRPFPPLYWGIGSNGLFIPVR